MTYPGKQIIPKNEFGMVDIKLYLYELLKNYVPLIEQIGQNNIFYVLDDAYKNLKNNKNTIFLQNIGSSTDYLGRREEMWQIDVYSYSMEQTDRISYILIDLLNRRNLDGIKIRLNNQYSGRKAEKGLFHNVLDFTMVFLDMNY